MEILNNSPLTIAPLIGRVSFPDHSLTIIIKGTFNLVPDGKAKFAEEGLFPTGDEQYPEDDEGDGSNYYESDFAYYKPRSDLLLVGKCYAPKGKSTTSTPITFKVGDIRKSLRVIGDREWKGFFKTPSKPIPFTEMDLLYENSYGGNGFSTNPVGKGHKKVKPENGENYWPLPKIEDPDNLITSTGDKPFPAGFGPLRREWQTRTSLLGNYKGDYMEKRWPWFAEDFDYGYFNAAHPDLQLEGYLRGDERIYFENMHPKISRYQSELPGIRPRCFLNVQNQQDDEFRELDLNLDTLWIDAEQEMLILVWRGVTPVASEDYEEITDLYLTTEELADQAGSKERHRSEFISFLSEEEEQVVEEESTDEPADEEDEDVDAIFAEQEEKLWASLAEQGIDPDEKIAEGQQSGEEEQNLLRELGFEPEVEETPLTRELIYQRYSEGESFKQEDLSGLDLSGLDLSGINLQEAILSNANLVDSNLSGAILSLCVLESADLTGANLQEADLTEADLTGATLCDADMQGTTLQGILAEEANLEKVNFEGATGPDALFSHANLAGVMAEGVDFTGADFSNATLNDANFIEANLTDASLEGVTGIHINLSRANLTRLRASEGANFAGGKFIQSEGKESIWEGANLKEAEFQYAKLFGADFTKTNLEGADYSGVNMRESRFNEANLTDAKFVYMNLFRGSLEKANLLQADFRNSNLYEVEFLDSVTDGALFNFANLKMSKLADE